MLVLLITITVLLLAFENVTQMLMSSMFISYFYLLGTISNIDGKNALYLCNIYSEQSQNAAYWLIAIVD